MRTPFSAGKMENTQQGQLTGTEEGAACPAALLARDFYFYRAQKEEPRALPLSYINPAAKMDVPKGNFREF